MAYIEPNTDIILLHNVPFDNTYRHTVFFNSVSDQHDYFYSLRVRTLDSYTYQRVNSGVLKVGLLADLMYSCNYMMFKNSNFGSRWFYAFITSVEYVNNSTSEIHYELDVLQTWHFDYSLRYCFVEREHPVSDNIGENLQPEPVNLGEYVCNTGYGKIDDFMNAMCVILAIVDTTEESDAKQYDNVYSGADLWAFDTTQAGENALKQKMNEYLQKPDAIIGMYMCPRFFISEYAFTGGTYHIESGQGGKSHVITRDKLTTTHTLDHYKPRNNKLYTYPFNFYHIDNNSGQELNLRYEFFTDLTPTFTAYATILQPVSVALYPNNYKGVKRSTTEMISITGFPLCGWVVDSYQAWIAQNSIPMLIDSAKNTVAGAFTAGIPGAVTGAIGSAINAISSGYKASIAADISKGTQLNANVNISHSFNAFYGGRMSINRYTAPQIDSFFDMYGYATNQVKVPNRTSRPHWNYVKTSGCTIHGSVPADAVQKICSIYDNGITFWKNGSEIGQYSLNNKPA